MYIFKDRDKRFLQLLQQVYIEKLAIIYTFETTGSNPDTSIFEEELFPVSLDTKISKEERWIYQKIVGSILFAIISSRPDITFTVLQLFKFNQRPVLRYIEAVKRVVRQLYKIRFLYLQYRGQRRDSTKSFIYINDTSFADNILNRKSSQRYMMKFFGGPVV